MKLITKKIVISIVFFGLLIIGLHFALQLTLGVNYSATLETNYENVSNSERHLINSRWATLETPDNWRNIVHTQNCPGYVGALWTGRGFIHYEYGFTAPVYSNNQEFDTEIDTINDLLIEISRNDDLTALYVPQQKEMTAGLTFYASETSTILFDTLIDVVKTLKFKK